MYYPSLKSAVCKDRHSKIRKLSQKGENEGTSFSLVARGELKWGGGDMGCSSENRANITIVCLVLYPRNFNN